MSNWNIAEYAAALHPNPVVKIVGQNYSESIE